MKRNYKAIPVALLILLYLCGAAGAAQEQDERATLQEQLQGLQKKVIMLKQEQDFLLFKKVMYAADSKYLVLNITNKTGQLKYKNKALKDFSFSSLQNYALQPGRLVLTKKMEGSEKSRYALIFGRGLILQWMPAAVPEEETRIPSLSLTEKDMRSIFFAIEEGSPAYIVL